MNLTQERAARFRACIDQSPGHGPWGTCHLWTLSTRNGYGQFSVGGRNGTVEYAHRIAFYLAFAYLPPVVRHRCDCRPCCNVEHLLGGDQSANVQDMIDRGRDIHPFEISATIVAAIRASPAGVRSTARAYGVSPSYVSLVRNSKRRTKQ